MSIFYSRSRYSSQARDKARKINKAEVIDKLYEERVSNYKI
jgi:hypothetical protein